MAPAPGYTAPMRTDGDANLVLIGLPGAGKSTVGVLLAKATGRNFVDSDVFIQAGQDRSLREIIEADGLDAFRRVEEQYVLCLEVRGYVIATGGSVVYSTAAMRRLKAGGPVIYLSLAFETVERRVRDTAARGVVMEPGQSLRELYDQRRPLYERWADVTVDCEGRNQEQVLAAILAELE